MSPHVRRVSLMCAAAALAVSGLMSVGSTARAVSSPFKPIISTLNGSSMLTSNGSRLTLDGATVWGIPGFNKFTVDFSEGQYENRDVIARTIKSRGGNVIRLRIFSADIAASRWLTQPQYMARIKDWVTVAKKYGLVTLICDWSTHDDEVTGAYIRPDWFTHLYTWLPIHKMINDYNAADPYILWEPWNEPDGSSQSAWLQAMKVTLLYYRRTMGYHGPVFLDTRYGSTEFDPGMIDTLISYDAEVNGVAQVGVAHHSYAVGATNFSNSQWLSATGGGSNKYVVFETEWGNWTGGSDNSPTWSSQAAKFFADRSASQTSLVGAVGFLWGPWSDPNSLTGGDNVTPNGAWGKTFNWFLSIAGASAVPTS